MRLNSEKTGLRAQRGVDSLAIPICMLMGLGFWGEWRDAPEW